MGETIDNKIVGMEFENDNFVKGVDESLNSIDKLKKGLNFDKAADSFNSISAAANKVNLGSIAEGVSNISSKFTALGIIAITTLANITNAALNAGITFAKSLTIDPVKDGFKEYEDGLNAFQTIMANVKSSGASINDVNDTLKVLNQYANLTIFSFGDMTKAIGLFTAQGVNLKDSVTAIKGIFNIVSLTGGNAEKANSAIYQLSQAIASGVVKAQDWISVVNAGFGGTDFQNQLKQTARVHGVMVDDLIKKEGSFRESLKEGWLTSKVLLETLSQYTTDITKEQLKSLGYTEEQAAQIQELGGRATESATKLKTATQVFETLRSNVVTSWATTFKLIIGDLSEASDFWTSFANGFGAVLQGSNDARNALLTSWKDLGGRTALLKSFENVLNAIITVLNPIKAAFQEIFPPTTAQQLVTLSKALETFTSKLILSGKDTEKIRTIFKGVFALLDIGRMAFAAIAKEIFKFSGSLGGPITSFTDLLVKVSEYIIKIRDNIKITDAFGTALSKLRIFLEPLGKGILLFFSYIQKGFDFLKNLKFNGFTDFAKGMKLNLDPLTKMAQATGKILTLLGALFQKVAPIFLKLGGIVADGVSGFVDKLMASLDTFDPNKVFQIINGGLLAGILLAIKKFISKGTGVFSGVADILDSVKGSLEAWQTSLKADTLLKIAAALGVMTISVVALSLIDPKKLTSALAAITVMFVQLGASLTAFQKVTDKTNPAQMAGMAIGLIGIATAMLLMSAAMSKLGKLSGKQLLKGILAISALTAVVKVTAESLKGSSAKMIVGAAALIVFSFAIRSFSTAVIKLGEIDTGALIQGLIGVGALMTELALFMKTTDLSGMGVLKSVGILILAAAIDLLAIAVGKMAKIDTDSIARGLIAMGLIFSELAGFIALTGGGLAIAPVAAGVLILSAAMLVMAKVLQTLGKESWEEIARGITSMALALTVIGAAAYLIPPTLIVTAAGLVVMAGGLVILAKAMKTMGGMSWDEVARGLTVLAGSLAILVIALTAMSGTFLGSAALVAAAAGLALLAPALKVMGGMSWEEIGRGLVALAGAFVVLGVAGAVMTPVIPTLAALAGAMLLIGVATALAGAGILAFSAGLAALAVSGAAGGAALVVIITSIVGLVPMLVKQLGLALLTLVDVLVAGAPKLLTGIVTLLTILAEGLIKVGPKIITAVLTLLGALLTQVAAHLPEFVQAGYDIILAFLKGFDNNVADVVKVVVAIAVHFVQATKQVLPTLTTAGWELMIAFINSMATSAEANIPLLMDALRNLGLSIVKGIIEGIVSGNVDAKQAIIELANIIIDGFKEVMGIHSPADVFITLALAIIQGLVQGLQNGSSLALNAIKNLGSLLISTMQAKVGAMSTAGKDLVQGFAQGIRNYTSEAINAAASLASAVLEKIRNVFQSHSPARATMDIGKDADMGMAIGITKFAGLVLGATKEMGSKTLSGFSSIVGNISDSLNSNMDFQPQITPVVDLSNIKDGSAQIDSLFSNKSLSVNMAASTASNINAAQQAAQEQVTATTTPVTPTQPIQYIQNNYSPKELSRIEIYRQTRNQLFQAKSLLKVGG